MATENLHEIKGRRGNFIPFQNDGSEISLFESDYKTTGNYGPITTHPQKFDYLYYYLKVYIKSFRTRLLCGKTHSFLFCNTKGDPFSGATYNLYVGRFYERRCLTCFTTTDLRKAMVT